MATTINIATIDNNIYKNFYDILNAVSGLTGIIYTEFPEIKLDSSDSYPIAVLDSAINPWDKITMGRNKVEGHIDFSYYAITPKDRDTISSRISDAIQNAKPGFSSVKLQKIRMDISKDMVPHGNIKVYIVTVTINYRFTFLSVRGY